MRERLIFGELAAPAAGMAQRADEQMGGLAPPPGCRRVGQLEPVPLGFLTRRMLNDPNRPVFRRCTGLARRAQPPGPDLAGQRRIRPVKPQWLQLIEQRHRPQMRVLDQPGGHIVDERCERIRLRRGTFTGSAFAGQVVADRLAVMTQMPGDRGDRPALAGQRMRVQIFLPCEHGRRAPSSWRVVRDRQPRRSPTYLGGATRGGEFQ